MEKQGGNTESLVLNAWPDVGRALNLSKPTIYSLIRQGAIPSIRFGRRVVVPRKALEDLLASATKTESVDNGTDRERKRSDSQVR